MKNFKIDEWFIELSQKASKQVDSLIERAKMTEHFFLMSAAVIIGLLAGFAAVGIKLLIEFVSELSFPGSGSLLENMQALPWYYILFIPAIGGLIAGPLIYYLAPEAKGHGVPEVMEALILKNGKIRPRVALIKTLASAITIGTGGSVGREGPMIQIGSTLGSAVAQFFRLPPKRMKVLVGCGAAAGIAAAFNAPIAGALFAIEIVLMDFKVASFSPIVISSVIATVVSHSFEGNFAEFKVPGYSMVSNYEVMLYILMGALSGVVSWIYIKILYNMEEFWDKHIRIKPYLKAVLGGLAVGAIALAFPQILGVGYDSMDAALNNRQVWDIAIILVFLKMIASSLTLSSGGSGGVFAPSLYIGAMLGAFFGSMVNMLFPEYTASPGAYALVAMGGLVAGTTRAPITAIIIVFELTKETSIILPLMLTCTLSMIISMKFSRESIYTLKLLQKKINIKSNTEINVLKSISVAEIYSKSFETIPESVTFNVLVEHLIYKNRPYISVTDSQDRFAGMVSLYTIKEFLFDKDVLKDLMIAGDVADRNITKIFLDENAKDVMDKMGKCNFDGLPVMDRNNPDKQIGMIWRNDLDKAYHKELARLDMTLDIAQKIQQSNIESDVQIQEGYAIAEVKVPDEFIGKSIKDIGIRSNYGVDVISIKTIRGSNVEVKAIPSADYVITNNDVLIVAGAVRNINLLKHLT